MIRFPCSKCSLKLVFGPECAGSSVSCPGCGLSLTVPGGSTDGRPAWNGTDPTSPNIWTSLGLGLGLGLSAVVCLLALATQYTKSLLHERGVVNYAETFFFGWGMAFLILKHLKLRHQQSALRLDLLPPELGREVTTGNVQAFIQHVHSLPAKFGDSLVVNRVLKALEHFAFRQDTGEVATMMANQSNLDSARSAASFTLVKVFIWTFPSSASSALSSASRTRSASSKA